MKNKATISLMISKKKLIVIAGPTAVGKTDFALQLAQHFNTAIISADSRQCYLETNIGTAKPSLTEQQNIPHYFLNEFPLETPLSAADFESYALKKLQIIFEQNDYAIVAGGTGLYIDALCNGLDPMPAIDEAIAIEMEQQFKENGLIWLQNQLKQKDPLFYENGAIENPSRALRALIFVESHQQSILTFQQHKKVERPFEIYKFFIHTDREKLYQKIDHRVLEMIEKGLITEAEALFPKRHLKSLNTVGYKELFDFFENKISLAMAITKIQQHSRNYAKRQITWFKKDPTYILLAADKLNVTAFVNQYFKELS